MAIEVSVMFIQHGIHSVAHGDCPGERENIFFLGVKTLHGAVLAHLLLQVIVFLQVVGGN